jgi:hypothetical protein
LEKLEGMDWKAILTLPRSSSVSSPVEIEERVDDWNKYKKSGNKPRNIPSHPREYYAET